MTTQMTATIEQRMVMNSAYKIGVALGRKFDTSDVTGNRVLMQAADAFVNSYHGTFEYMLDMVANQARFGWLTPNQAKGVLNCMMAEARRNLNGRAVAAATPPAKAQPVASVVDYAAVSNGTYTIVFDAEKPADCITLRIADWQDFTDKATGRSRDDVRSVGFLAGPDNTADFRFAVAITPNSQLFSSKAFGPRVQQALRLLVQSTSEDRAAMGAAYAFASSRCWRCHRELTVDDSVAGGIGPVCAKKVGAAYGQATLDAAKEAMARLKAAAAPSLAVVPTSTRTYQDIFGDEEDISA